MRSNAPTIFLLPRNNLGGAEGYRVEEWQIKIGDIGEERRVSILRTGKCKSNPITGLDRP